jgi:hypothetical protein
MATLISGSPACSAYSPLDIGVMCSTSAYPVLNCTVYGLPGGPYSSEGMVSPDGRSVNGVIIGSDFTVEWRAERGSVAVTSLTDWGIVTLIILTGLAGIYALRQRRREVT